MLLNEYYITLDEVNSLIPVIFCLITVQALRVSSSMKLDTPEFHAILTPELKKLAAIFAEYGFENELRIVGGAVRDLLTNKKPADLDFATTATPQEMKNMFNAKRVRMIHTNGELHGTITVRINNKENFEITTLRDDVITDGRHAVVQFTKDWFVDATRRDLTVNAMYLDLEGNLYDYYHGYEDLMNNRVMFVGDADKRIKEDYLRILRYFRFFGRIAKDAHNHDQKTLQAIRDNVSGLEKISGERIWSELHRIITGNFVNEIMKVIISLGLAQYIGLSQLDHLDIACFDVVCGNVEKYSFQPITIMATLMKTKTEMLTFHNRVKLSSSERDLGCFIVENKNVILPDSDEACLKHFQRMLILSKIIRELARTYIIELLKVADREEVLKLFNDWNPPTFPINGDFMMKRGIKGVKLGLALNELKEKWIDNDFILGENEISTVVEKFKNAD